MFSPLKVKYVYTQSGWGVGLWGGKGVVKKPSVTWVFFVVGHPAESKGKFSMKLWKKTN